MAVPPTPDQIAAARRALIAADPALARAHAQTPAFEWRARTGGFEGLFRMIVEQQVSVVAAAAIWKRVVDGLGGGVTADGVLSHDIETLRSFGLSRPKALYAHEIARAQTEGRIDFDHLERLDDAEATAALVAIKGVGLWTAETFLMFCDGRADVFPAGDIAIQEALRWADRLDARPSTQTTYVRAEAWAPYRSVAAHLLWGWYGGVKRGDIQLEAADALAEKRDEAAK